jgi:non-homologous end joining protein Ku
MFDQLMRKPLIVLAQFKELAEVIIDRKTGHFEHAKFEDRYENASVARARGPESFLKL